ncbi:MAG: AbrB/MazE/SpoVT family DNA-binding domain-containing protein [Candidatus Magasanikbacteria bacterium]|nr:AbrB/MazE/SpoVT family DNA-binding domain-containing protein [Candidatus Magasanikbacteria bacterium]MCA9390868.1 AbrB/MazE/SpoVT family DNA-binding domain-containing protein [Candidatus Magasanikbacteria bacterium]USN52187.1 MAG: AbrB/MazE/SpoVT family DNA-binding domain-containing protein [Candidatus Nomurabacteria bacterium]HPF95279.1 AbrB/MazE/SpoVT family DNA-binding domain-containing protein [bacterium]
MIKKPSKKGDICPFNPKDALVGAAVLGERGQIVIPKEMREKLGFKSGDRIVLMQNGDGPLVILPASSLQEMVASFSDRIAQALKNV